METEDFTGVFLTGIHQLEIKEIFEEQWENSTLIYIIEGNGTVAAGKQMLDYKEKQVVLTNQSFSLNPKSTTKLYLLRVKNAEEFFATRVLDTNDKVGHLSILTRFKTQISEQNREVYSHSAVLYGYIMGILSFAERKAAEYTELVGSAVEIIESEYSALGSVEALADMLNISKHHLIREFGEQTGTTPGKYLEEIRLKRAELLLRCTDYTVEMIANMVGFSGGNYFGKVFCKNLKCTPANYRKTNKQKVVSLKEKELLAEIEAVYLV